ncbi:MAG: S41 family peptidase [Dysgonamonadaceae bacterium]|jgi:carboxyl-terminal processing protease|nr:S41 family peptidase [Dysgonamonadaceae bacterium]
MKVIQIGIAVFIALLGSHSSKLFAQLSEEQRFEITRNIDIFNSLFKELNLYYVDTLNVKKIIQDDIFYMLQQLDPYTEYISEEDMQDFQFQTTGEYGGIGTIISMRNGKIIVVDPYENMPAALAGLIPGDEILAIEDESMEGKTSSYASERLKGQPHTKIKIKFRRTVEKKPREVTIKRERIHIDPVTYYGVLKEKTGYIYLSGFTVNSARSVKDALLDLKNNHQIASLIIDLRNNGGGVIEECMDILNFFLPKGELLFSLKGKAKPMDRIYRATQEPVEADLPLVVLVNENSASASEILSGTIQDLDRGVIVGTRTYGKGLVQSTRELPYNGKLKLTTAKYYIPSGRSIQSIDYSNKDENGKVSYIPDSLTTVYYTSRNRPVRDGGGILPDFVIEEEKMPTMIYYLEANSIFFDFVVQWREKHPKIASPSEFVLTDQIYTAFKEFVKLKNFTYDRQSERALETMKKIMEFEGYYDAAREEFQALENKLKPDLERDLELHKKQIIKYLSMQIMKQYYYAKGQLVYELREDATLNKALEIIQDKELYNNTLKNTENQVTH